VEFRKAVREFTIERSNSKTSYIDDGIYLLLIGMIFQ
jgi:hypothetical protein